MFTDALLAVVKMLTDAGINASLDPADVSPPGVVVRGDAIIPASGKLCGDGPLRTSLLLVAPATNTVAAYRALDDLYARVQAAGVTLSPDERVFQRLVMPDDPTGLPALRVTTLTRVTQSAPIAPRKMRTA